MLTVRPSPDKPDLVALRADCKRLKITQDFIAREAGVTRPLVVNVFAGRDTSRNVVDTIRRLIARAERRMKRKAS